MKIEDYRKEHFSNVRLYEIKSKHRGKCLNLGSGNIYIPGYINLDWNKDYKPDVTHNLNNFPYPFNDGEFDYVYCSHILEHIDNFYKALREIIRITKVGGIIHIRLPHFSYSQTFADLTHKHYFGALTFRQLLDGDFNERFENIKIVKERLNYFSVGTLPKLNKFISYFFNKLNWIVYERFLCWIFPVTEIEIKLIKINDC